MQDDKIVALSQPGEFTDSLTEVPRNGARQLLTQAVETNWPNGLGRNDRSADACQAWRRGLPHIASFTLIASTRPSQALFQSLQARR